MSNKDCGAVDGEYDVTEGLFFELRLGHVRGEHEAFSRVSQAP
ncbi:hypothetical protein [Streptomyces sp. NPDC001537]